MTESEAVDLLWGALAANEGWYAFELGSFDGRRLELACRVDDRTRFRRWSLHHGWSSELTVGCRPYLERKGRRLYADSGAVWCRLETGAQVRALEAFDVEPSLIIREGGSVRHTAVWAVRNALDPDDGVKMNKHLAHHFRAPKKWAEQLWLAPPGAVLREGRSRPCPIVAAGGSGELYGVGRVAATLPREIPDPDAWRTKTAA